MVVEALVLSGNDRGRQDRRNVSDDEHSSARSPEVTLDMGGERRRRRADDPGCSPCRDEDHEEQRDRDRDLPPNRSMGGGRQRAPFPAATALTYAGTASTSLDERLTGITRTKLRRSATRS